MRGRARKTNVVEVASSLVGRDDDLTAIADLFDGGARLVTVAAVGGMGKSRVVARFAALHAEAYARGGGAWLCDLTEATTAMDVCAVVASVLGVRLDASGTLAIEALGAAIANRRRVLVVLDNVEQVAAAAREALKGWMSAAPRAHFLAASRVTLDVPGEHVARLSPLALPAPGLDDAALAAVPSVDLFLRRARAVRPGFATSAGDLAVAADVARSLDGIPLAIELAAARAAVLTPAQIRARLTTPLDVLAQRDDGGRHASMRRAIGDSYAQLRDADKACLARCAFFRGGFTFDAAERVIGPALAEIEALAGRSLVRASEEPDGGVRFSMYETIREFALEQLSPDEHAEIARAHCRTFAEIGGARASTFAERRRERAALERELDNLTLAHATAEAWAAREPEGGAPALLLSLALSLDAVLAARGLPLERRRALDAAIARGAPGAPRVHALVARGRAWHELGGFDRAREDLGAACDAARAIDDAALEALASVRLGEVVELAGSTVDAQRLFAHALLLLARSPASPERDLREAEALLRVGHAHRREGDLDEAERETARAVSLYRDLGDDEGLAGALYEAATIALFRRQYEASEARFQEGLELARRVDARTVEAALTTASGTLALERGDLDAALERHTRGVALFREIGNRYREGSALYYLAQTYGLRGAADEATQLLRRALPIVRGAGVPRYVALIEGYRAALAADAGDIAGAREALAAGRAALDACPGEPTLAAAIDVHALHVAHAAASPDARAAILERARAIPGDCDDPRFALRLLELRAAPQPADDRVLAVAADAGRFRAPGAAAWVDLETRAPLRRILAALANERVERPGDCLAVEQLVAAGWPGERIGYAAATNRVHVALATLRKLGLRDVLVRGEGGYLLTPGVRLALTT